MQPDEERLMMGRLLLGAAIRSRRSEAGLQLAEFAERAGMTVTYLSDIERGNRLPSLGTLDAIAEALDTVASELLSGIYPWGTHEPPADLPEAVPDGRAGRTIRRRGPASS